MPKVYRLEGQRFGRWTVIEQSGVDKRGEKLYRCECDCGTIKEVKSSNLRNGTSSSCGCLARELTSERSKTHGMSNSRLFNIWSGMRTRCNNPNDYHYKWYGERGVRVCDEWNDFETFQNWANDNGYDEDLSIDRINTNGDYEPSNCRWVTQYEQMNNTRKNVKLTYNGDTKCLAEWAREIGIKDSTIRSRLARGSTVEEALGEPVKQPHTVSTIIDINGESKSVQDWSKVSGISPKMILYRLSAGWTPELAIFEPTDSSRVYGGKIREGSDFWELAKANGISQGTFRYRIRKGMTPEEAASKPLRKKKKLQFAVESQEA